MALSADVLIDPQRAISQSKPEPSLNGVEASTGGTQRQAVPKAKSRCMTEASTRGQGESSCGGTKVWQQQEPRLIQRVDHTEGLKKREQNEHGSTQNEDHSIQQVTEESENYKNRIAQNKASKPSTRDNTDSTERDQTHD